MSAARTALDGLVGVLASAVEPAQVAVRDDGDVAPQAPGGSGEGGSSVGVRPVALTRLGRSQREGTVLDLELLAAVTPSGPHALELAEQMLTVLERQPRLTVEASPGTDPALAFRVRLPVAVRLDEPVRWRVEQPMRLDVQLARSVDGVVVDAGGNGVQDALVSIAAGGRPARSDADGRFQLLVADESRQALVVEVRGATRTLDVATDSAPVVVRWE